LPIFIYKPIVNLSLIIKLQEWNFFKLKFAVNGVHLIKKLSLTKEYAKHIYLSKLKN
jgi:hypothetical protein